MKYLRNGIRNACLRNLMNFPVSDPHEPKKMQSKLSTNHAVIFIETGPVIGFASVWKLILVAVNVS